MNLPKLSSINLLLLFLGHGYGHDTAAEAVGRLRGRAGCGSSPAWQSTVEAWMNAETDDKSSSWWQGKSSGQHGTFANEIGRSFGDHLTGFECGIGAYSTCIAPGCSG
jgi:hypothetical protein